MTRPAHLGGALALVAAVGVAAAPQVRDGARVAAGSGAIAGTVLEGAGATAAARRVRVTLTDVTGAWPGRTTTTDDRGAFAFGDLPAGRFQVQAFKPGYLRASYGASRPERAGTPVVLASGETKGGLTLTIVRGGVIEGVVRDGRAQPVPGVEVRVLKLGYNAVTGEPTLGAAGQNVPVRTDDRGVYRAFGLPPGGYLVLLPGPPPQAPMLGSDDIRVLTSAEVRQALQAARSGGVAAAGGAAGQPAPPARVNYAPVFHPGVTDIGAAATVVLGLGEERHGVDLAVQLVPSATISGRISAPAMPLPPSLSVRVVPAGPWAEMLAGAGLRGLSAAPRADGSYAITGVPPGAYVVKAATAVAGGRGRAIVADESALWAAAEVVVSGGDLEVPLALQPGVSINGRVVFEGAQPTAAELQALSLQLVPLAAGGAALYSGGGRVDGQGRFAFKGVPPDTYQFTTAWTAAGAADRWTVVASVANERDAFEAPLRVWPNTPVEWTVTFTDRPTGLAGVLQDREGRPAPEFFVLVFSADRGHWTPGSRRVRMTRPGTDGSFGVRGVPPGDYLVAALTDLEPGEWNDPTLLDQLVASAVRLTLRKGEITRQDLRIGGSTGARSR